jgi:EpsI family protein
LLADLVEAARDPLDRWRLAGAILSLLILGTLFAGNLNHFAYTWSTDDNYSHGFLVPLLSLYFANDAAGRHRPALGGRERGVWLGSLLLLVGILGKLATVLIPIGVLGDLSLLACFAGVVTLFGSRSLLRRYAFAIGFLAFMIPLPIALYSSIATPLQLAVSRIAAVVLSLVGIPVLRQGNMMTLPGGVNMFVAEACSGMRQMTGFLALSTAVAYLTARPWWYRGLLVASSLPIAMIANVVRVVLTGVIMFRIDPKYAAGSFHTAEGLVMMGFGLLLLGGFGSILNLVFPAETDAATPAAASDASASSAHHLRGRGTVVARLVPGLALPLAGLAGLGSLEASSTSVRPALIQPLATLPYQIGPWIGEDQATDPEIVRRAQTDDYLNRSYVDPSHPGRRLSVWINYSRHGLNLRHSPKVCLPSGGWEEVESQTSVLNVQTPGGTLPVTKLAYRQGDTILDVGFWYYIFGEGRLEQAVRRLPITSRSSHGRTTRGSGLTVEIFCPGELDPDGELIQAFVADLLHELEPLLPETRAAYFRP